MLLKLMVDLAIRAHRIFHRAVDDVDKDVGTLNMAQEVYPKSNAPMSTLDETRYIDHHEAVSSPLDHSQVGLESGERVVGYLWVGPADCGQHARLASVRQPNDPDVGQELQL